MFLISKFYYAFTNSNSDTTLISSSSSFIIALSSLTAPSAIIAFLITTFLPILTPGFIVVAPPIQEPSPISISLANSRPNFLWDGDIGWAAVNIFTLGPINTSSPITTLAQSSTVKL